MSRRIVAAALAAVVVIALLVGLLSIGHGPKPTRLTADFAETPGLYVGNKVDVIGMPVGRITGIKTVPTGVEVTMQVDGNISIPQQARAVLMAPEVVNDRYVQLDPAFSGGAKMASGSFIPRSRTLVPVSVDEVINTLDKLALALGPEGANKNGALGDLIHNLANSFGGTGSDLHATVVSFNHALGALAANPAQLTAVLNNLGQLTTAAANATGSYQSFARDLTAVSGSLAADNSDIAGALANLQKALGQLATFVQSNQSTIAVSLTNLQAFSATLAAQQKALAQVIDVGPLALQNLVATIDPAAPGGPALRGRYDPMGGSKGMVQTLCGNITYRGLIITTNPPVANTQDLDCLLSSTLTALSTPPGASTGPDLSLAALLRGAA